MGDPDTNMDFENAFKASSSASRNLPTLRTPVGDHPAGREQGTLRQLNPGSIRVGFGAFWKTNSEAKLKVGQSPPHLKWHFIGHLQSGSRDAVRLFHMIHGVDSMKLAQALQEQCDNVAHGSHLARSQCFR